MTYDLIIPEKMFSIHGHRAHELYQMCIDELKTEYRALLVLLTTSKNLSESRLKLHNMLGTARIMYHDTLCRKIEMVQKNLKSGKQVINSHELRWIENEIKNHIDPQHI